MIKHYCDLCGKETSDVTNISFTGGKLVNNNYEACDTCNRNIREYMFYMEHKKTYKEVHGSSLLNDESKRVVIPTEVKEEKN